MNDIVVGSLTEYVYIRYLDDKDFVPLCKFTIIVLILTSLEIVFMISKQMLVNQVSSTTVILIAESFCRKKTKPGWI